VGPVSPGPLLFPPGDAFEGRGKKGASDGLRRGTKEARPFGADGGQRVALRSAARGSARGGDHVAPRRRRAPRFVLRSRVASAALLAAPRHESPLAPQLVERPEVLIVRPRAGGGFAVGDLGRTPVEIGAGERPVKRLGDLAVVVLERGDPRRERVEICEVVGGARLALEDREADLSGTRAARADCGMRGRHRRPRDLRHHVPGRRLRARGAGALGASAGSCVEHFLLDARGRAARGRAERDDRDGRRARTRASYRRACTDLRPRV
jgi:hypothetical protein